MYAVGSLGWRKWIVTISQRGSSSQQKSRRKERKKIDLYVRSETWTGKERGRETICYLL